MLVLGVFSGSALWWLALSGGVSLFRNKFTPHRLHWLNWLAGLVITGFGLLVLMSLLK
jgi:arginine exporter protein ArgO